MTWQELFKNAVKLVLMAGEINMCITFDYRIEEPFPRYVTFVITLHTNLYTATAQFAGRTDPLLTQEASDILTECIK
jgi:hypothetical protein